MLKSSGAMGIATIVSRILGMAREMCYAHFMGAGVVAGAFTIAFTIPNLFRRLLGEGALTAAFIPIFKEKEIAAGEKEMWRSANAVISGMLVAATAIIAVAILGISLILAMAAPTPGGDGEAETLFAGGFLNPERVLMLRLLRVMFPYLVLVCFSAICVGILNARGRFFLPALGPTILNLILIAAVFWLAPFMGKRLEEQIFALAIGVLVAGAAQAAYLVPVLYGEGYRFEWISPWGNETVRLVVQRMVPGMMGVAAFQLNVAFTQLYTGYIDASIVAAFNYAVRLMELPQGVFGISLATFLLPTLAKLAGEKNYTEFRGTLRQGIGYLATANLLASALLIVLAQPIMRLLFERGEFDANATSRSGFALACLAPGLIAFSLVNILARAFYALGDTRTPMKISAVCLGLNLILTVWMVGILAEGGLGLANSISAGVNVGLLIYALRRKLRHLDLGPLKAHFLSMAGAAVLAAMLAWTANHFWERAYGQTALWAKLGAVFIPLGLATMSYALLLLWLRVPEAKEFLDLFLRKFVRPKP